MDRAEIRPSDSRPVRRHPQQPSAPKKVNESFNDKLFAETTLDRYKNTTDYKKIAIIHDVNYQVALDLLTNLIGQYSDTLETLNRTQRESLLNGLIPAFKIERVVRGMLCCREEQHNVNLDLQKASNVLEEFTRPANQKKRK